MYIQWMICVIFRAGKFVRYREATMPTSFNKIWARVRIRYPDMKFVGTLRDSTRSKYKFEFFPFITNKHVAMKFFLFSFYDGAHGEREVEPVRHSTQG
jgi:hypothetical protein